MAYAALVSLDQTITHILSRDRYSFILRKQQLASIHENVILLQDFLESFPHKSNESLERRIMDSATQAEDTIEYIFYSLKEISFEAFFKYSFYRLKGRTRLAQSIVEIDSLVMGMKQNSLGKNDPAVAGSSSTHDEPLHKKDGLVIGLDADLLAVKERLCGGSSGLQIIPIVGMGGIGKTTLAHNAYHDPLITESFLIRAWVAVSQDCSLERIISDLLVSTKDPKTGRYGQENELELYQSLKGKRYLIVMDDLWSTKAWDDIKRIFPDDDNGSRVILTTRLADVAAHADSSKRLHEMNLMDAKQSWDLLRHKVFADKHCPQELEYIGKEIARSCRGLPLAIVVIAGLLSPDSNSRALWKEIAENVQAAISTRDEQFEKIMSLSYTYLPHHLRPCFLYMGVFPEDYEIRASKLIKLWVAENFLKPSESKSLEEEIGEEYLKDLVKRNLVLVSKKKSNGKIKSCSIHDLMRELCIRKAEQEKFFVHVMDRGDLKRSTKNQRRVCVNQSDKSWSADIFSGLTIRTMITFEQSVDRLEEYLRNCRFLRVLQLVFARNGRFAYNQLPLPDQVLRSFHLRYLALDYDVEIPSSGLSNLEDLQTLIIHPRWKNGAPWRVRLPLEIWRMRQLRHLVGCNFDGLPNPEKGDYALENLQTLSVVTNLVCTESIMKMIPNLKKLGIYYSISRDDDDDDDDKDKDYHLENLVHLRQLEKLKLNIGDCPFYSVNKFSTLTFPIMLKRLTLRGFGIHWKDMMRIVGSLRNLQVLKLRNVSIGSGGKWETSEGEFPELEYLLIDSPYTLGDWVTESSHFPKLKSLLLHHCLSLIEIPQGIGEIETLELIEIKGCMTSLAESAKRIQEEQQDYGNDALQVRHDDITASSHIAAVAAAAKARRENVYMAKLAEQAQRYEEMVEFMEKVCSVLPEEEEEDEDLSEEEMNLLSVAYKNVICARINSLRIISSMEHEEESRGNESDVVTIKSYRYKIEWELSAIYDAINKLLDTGLIPTACASDLRVYYLKKKGDYHMYLAQFKTGDEWEEAVESALTAYNEAQDIAYANLAPTHPIRLGLALNFSIFYYEILHSPYLAYNLVKQAFDQAIGWSDTLDEDSTLTMQLLHDNLTLWISEMLQDDCS